MKSTTITGIVAALLAGTGLAGADDWPQWMGPERDSVWNEKGVAKSLPEGGPKILWRTPVHHGYSGPAVVGERVFLTDYRIEEGKVVNDPGMAVPLKGKERTVCLSLKDGKQLWEHVVEVPYKLSYPGGPRATPTVIDGRVYALGGMGHLTCLDAENGKVLWSHDLPAKYGGEVPIWGHSAHPLVVGDMVYCMVGGPGSAVMAFDAKSGKQAWKAIDAAKTSYAPLSLINLGQTDQLLAFTPWHLHSLDPASGKEYWKVKIRPDYDMSIMAPLESKGRVFVSGIGRKGLLVQVSDEGSPEAKVLWRSSPNEGVYCANSTPVIVGDVLYGNDIRTSSLIAVDLKDGKRLWETRKPTLGEGKEGRVNHGTVYIVRHGGNGLFYLFNEQGDLLIAECTPEGYREISRAHILEPTNEAFGRPVVWSMPAFAARSVFVRNDKELVRVDLSE